MTTQNRTIRTYTLTCRMTAEAAAIERLCQVTRIRGFRIEQMRVNTGSGELEISMTLNGERSIDMLCSQIEKLHTVRSLHAIKGKEQTIQGTGQLRQTA